MKFFRFVVLSLLFLNPLSVHSAGKFDVSWGVFNLEATTSKAKGSISGAGAYQLIYRRAFAPRLEFGLGYSVIVEKTYTGDMGYGPDLGLYYFPFTEAEPVLYENSDLRVLSTELWRPFISGAFHQRQYQSTQSSYAGFSVSFGTEYHWSSSFSIKGEVRSLKLTGPSDSKATETDVLLGLSVPF